MPGEQIIIVILQIIGGIITLFIANRLRKGEPKGKYLITKIQDYEEAWKTEHREKLELREIVTQLTVENGRLVSENTKLRKRRR